MGTIGTPVGALVGGNAARSVILEDYIFQSGIHDPEVSNILSYKYPQYYVTALLDRIGASETTAQNVFSWFTMDRTRQSGTIASLLEADGTAFVAGTSTDASFEVAAFVWDGAGALGYAVVGDVFRSEGGANFRVTASAQGVTDTDAQLIDVVKQDGTAITAAELANAMVIGHVFNSHVEGSSAPNGRTYLPTEDYNYTTILRRSFSISGTEFTNKTKIGDGGAWYYEQEGIEMKEFARDKEGLVMFGDMGTSPKASRGILDWAIAEGQSGSFAAATGVVETDIQDILQLLLVEGGSDKILCLAGSQFLADANRALKDYHVSGSINYGGFGGNEVGLDVQSYRFLGKTVDLVHYALFDDTAMVPYAGTASATKIDFSNFGLFLDMGTDDKGKKLISLKYKELNGQSRKFIHGYVTGMMSPEGPNGGHMSNSDDKFEINYLCEIGVEVRLANRMAILRATS